MRKLILIVGSLLFGQVGTALGQEDVPIAPATEAAAPTEAVLTPAVAARPASNFQVGAVFLPMLLGRLATGPSGNDTSSNLDFAYGVGLSFGYRVLAGLSVGVAPQVVFHLSAKDSAGYSVIESEKEYDLMARIAYAYAVAPKLNVYAEVLPGYSFVTYNKVVLGSQAPRARGMVMAGGLGATFDVSDPFFVNAGVGYQVGFQQSHGISDRDVKTKFLRIALGGGVKF
jgi:Outer membrane protein beta-barrel domain